MLKRHHLFASVVGAFSIFTTAQSLAISIPPSQIGKGATTYAPIVVKIGPKIVVTYFTWMNPEIVQAWSQGYVGQGVNMTVVDFYAQSKASSRILGNLGTGWLNVYHGDWTAKTASMIAPLATVSKVQLPTELSVSIAPVPLKSGLNVVNLSYGFFDSPNSVQAPSSIQWDPQTASIISYAVNGSAVTVKAAGNDNVAVNGINSGNNIDLLNASLIGAQSAIYVGALDKNGTVLSKAKMASYSNFAGDNATVQNNFLAVGVRGDLTGLYGTSFAAPIVSGYAAILGSKFTKASATQITNQLLNTARKDTVANYSAAVYGRGEASLSRALAPVSIK